MVFDGAMPLVLLLSVGDSSPLVFGIVASLGFIVSLLVVLRFRYQVTPFSSYFRETATALFRSDLRWRKQFTYCIINRLAWSTFAIAAVFVNAALIAVVSGLLPLLSIVNLSRGSRSLTGGARYHKITGRTVILFCVAGIGLAFTVASSTTSEQSGFSVDARTMLGLTVALVATFIQALGAFDVPAGIKLAAASKPAVGTVASGERASTLLVSCASAILSLPILCGFLALDVLLDATGHSSQISADGFIGALIAGIFLISGGTIMWRIAHLETTNLSIDALRYFTPLVSLGFIGVAELIGIAELETIRFHYLTLGACMILAANLLLYRLQTPGHSNTSIAATARSHAT